jgi:hypothetical protein
MSVESQIGPEHIILYLVEGLEIHEEINYEFYQRGPWYKQYGNDSDPDGEYEIKLNQGSIDRAYENKRLLLELGNGKPELLCQIITELLNKKLPMSGPLYVLSRTETGFQRVTPEPGDEHGWVWISGTKTKEMIENTILGFGPNAIAHLESIDSKRSKNLAAKIKRQEFVRKIRSIIKG